MASISVSLKSVPGTGAALGWAGRHAIVVDRPNGKAGGMGLGFSGGELLAFALGGGYANNLQFVAHDMGIAIRSLSVTTTVELDANADRITGAEIVMSVEAVDADADISELLARSEATSTVSNSVAQGIAVSVRHV